MYVSSVFYCRLKEVNSMAKNTPIGDGQRNSMVKNSITDI